MTVQVIGAFLAIFFFSILNNVPKRYLLYCGIEGAVGWFLYLIFKVPSGETLAIFLGTLGLAIMAHVFARVFKAPVTVFLIPGLLILVPGAGLYRFVYQMFFGTESMMVYYMLQTLQSAGMIALAVFVVDSFFLALSKWKK
ncbi:MAG TPA: threonine/serine exporter family protein [Candidatus Limivivens merdigallinarum]|uniref:Threonine/serine exporter family protein n=1 Tax=Candidatus Limivivens merdigallinarum TaxID=2840859 RepID=A0A9D0ZWR1_9FIRM|nr:threonine/serine exporter family protein [Candidatus Limivivens merdigallinarum]